MKVRLCFVNICRKDDEMYNPHLLCPRSERKISLVIWRCICYDGVGTLTADEGNINSAKYIDILDKNLWTVVVWYFEGKEYLFMDDNAPVHRAHTVENYKDQNEVTSMEWPAQSPDLNIIENIWLYMKRELQKSAVDITTKNDLLREIQSVWRNIELDYIRNLYQSIPDSLNNVIEMKGHLTKYQGDFKVRFAANGVKTSARKMQTNPAILKVTKTYVPPLREHSSGGALKCCNSTIAGEINKPRSAPKKRDDMEHLYVKIQSMGEYF